MGSISFQNDVHGTVGTSTETFGPGEYEITLQHGGTNICQDRDGDGVIDNQSGRWCNGCDPDYDYEAHVAQVGGDAEVTIENNQGECEKYLSVLRDYIAKIFRSIVSLPWIHSGRFMWYR